MEGIPDRGRSHAASFRAAEYKEARGSEMERLAEKYKAAQMEIVGLERDIERGIEHLQKQTDPEIIRISKEVGSEMLNRLEDTKNEKGELERAIKERGGEPSDYTVQ